MLHIVSQPAGNVAWALERLLDVTAEIRFGLLPVLDSTSHLRDSPSLTPYESSGLSFLGDQAVADRGLMGEMLEDASLFTGFDEAWLFTKRPLVPRPPGLAITTDSEEVADPDAIESWMRASGAWLGLGDGVGLRVIALDSQLADSLGRAL